jgi:citrate lyase synthetase
VGEEPEDALTSRYNSLMAQMLPSFGISTVVVPRLRLDGVVVSASRVRRALLE